MLPFCLYLKLELSWRSSTWGQSLAVCLETYEVPELLELPRVRVVRVVLLRCRAQDYMDARRDTGLGSEYGEHREMNPGTSRKTKETADIQCHCKAYKCQSNHDKQHKSIDSPLN